jgi:nucleotide-binding universal stress UspA family protein
MHLVLALNAELPQEWVVDATADFATKTGATVAVVCVDEVQLERLAPVPRSVFVSRAEEAASQALQRLRDAGIDATSTVLQGLARDLVLAFAEEQDADLVVVGASDRAPLATRLLGSVPLELLARATRPLLVIPTHHHKD